MITFGPVMQHVLLVERGGTNGKVDDPADRGGRTKDGITQNTYNAWRVEHDQPPGDVWAMADAERDDIYFHHYWLLGRCDLIALHSERLALCHMDACVHHGVRAVRKSGRIVGANVMLQELLGVTRDGWIGPATLRAIVKVVGTLGEAFLVENYLALRLKRFQAIATADPSQQRWLRPWRNRLDLLRLSLGKLPDAVGAM